MSGPALRWPEVGGKEIGNEREARVYQVLKEGLDFTCSILLGGRKVRALVDTGASVPLVSSKTYRQLDRKERLCRGFTFKPGRQQ